MWQIIWFKKKKSVTHQRCESRVANAEILARSIFWHFGGHFENHSQIGNSGSSVNIHLVGIYFWAKFGQEPSDNVLVKKYQITVLFLEIVILTFDPQTSSSWDLFLSAWVYLVSYTWVIVRNKKSIKFVLFLEVVTLTFDLQTSISIGFLLSPSGMCVPRFI